MSERALWYKTNMSIKENIDAMQKALKINCLSEEIKERFSSRLVKLGHYDAI